MGSRRAAFQAGQRPKIKPIPTLATRPPIGAHSGTYDGSNNRSSNVSPQPIDRPTIPPVPSASRPRSGTAT